MSEKIENALSDEEWRERKVRFVGLSDLTFHDDGDAMELIVWAGERVWEKLKFNMAPDTDLAALIALANSGLRDSNPRKITREKVQRLRAIAEAIRPVHENWDAKSFLEEVADALESYLPPEGT